MARDVRRWGLRRLVETARAGRARAKAGTGKRDYEAERELRYRRLLDQGFTKPEARGHAGESRKAVAVRDWRKVFKLSCTAISTTLINSPFGQGSWAWYYVAVLEDGAVEIVNMKQVHPDRINAMIRRHGCVAPEDNIFGTAASILGETAETEGDREKARAYEQTRSRLYSVRRKAKP